MHAAFYCLNVKIVFPVTYTESRVNPCMLEMYVHTETHTYLVPIRQKSFNYTQLGKHLIISLGDHDLRTTKETKATFRSVREIMIHYAYDPDLNRNDIAIVRLSSPVEFSRSLSPACLPREYR